jgi:putative transcriptional regulator
MKKKTTTVRIRADGTLVRIDSAGQEEPLSVMAIAPKTQAEIEAAAASDIDNPPITPERRMRLRPVPRVKTLRRALGLTQEEFADRYSIPLGTLRDWEQRRTEPDQAARAYLDVIARDPLTAARLTRRPDPNGTAKPAPTLQMGQRVYPKAAPSLQGAIIEIHLRSRGGFYYKVFHSADLIREYDEEQLAVIEKEH